MYRIYIQGLTLDHSYDTEAEARDYLLQLATNPYYQWRKMEVLEVVGAVLVTVTPSYEPAEDPPPVEEEPPAEDPPPVED